MQGRQRKHSEADLALIEKYGDGKKFAETFNPDLQKACAANLVRTFTGDAPTINALKSAYNEKQVRVWVLAQLENLNQYAGTRNKMEPAQMTMLAEVILTEYGYFKASELLLFFFQFKAGRFGELYGSVDPVRVSSALVEFASYRRDMIARVLAEQEEERKREERESHAKEAITWEEYQKRKSDRE